MDPRVRGTRARVPDRRRPRELRRDREARRCAVLRDRGGRIRHGVLRQAREVRPLPPAHRDAEQPRIRSRGHLSRRRRDQAAIQPAAAHRARRGTRHRQRARIGISPRPWAGMLDAARIIRQRPNPGADWSARIDPAAPAAGSRCARMAARSAASNGHCSANTTS